MALGARLKQLRLKKGETLQEVADAVGGSKAHIWDIETGKARNPTLDLLTRLASHFETTVSILVGEEPLETDSPELLVMFRDLKGLSERDRETIQAVMKSLKKSDK
ncbi:MAG: hypothetical protein JWQ90_1519 [Hydrocarboniphaga sp.]|uniref:helix-turn-helix domain-containing protein n=1 Tax=Hydrocarboniphaga sp. TaxID=2033016 RepID=UPI002627E4B0|nr:helix-turn-helix transcriptional regulator [Hydrocarboniphaga sp.]MDB5969069.1 hypothetical protein [Hydrocarboniphaga sp.]